MVLTDDQVITVLDVETTGLAAAHGDRICEVGLVRARGDEILATYQSFVNPQRPISPGAARVNGISDAQVAAAPLFAEIAADVFALIEGAALVCHNAPFDLSFLDAEVARLGLVRPAQAVFDTLDIARRYYRFRSNSLASVSASLGVTNRQAHRALGDALTTFYVLRTFYRQLSERGVFLEAHESADSSWQTRPSFTGFPPRQAQERDQAAAPRQTDVPLPPEIQAAISENSVVEIVYLDAQGKRTCRRITPRQVMAQNGSIHLMAFCHLRQAERSFRLDRIVAIHAPPPAHQE